LPLTSCRTLTSRSRRIILFFAAGLAVYWSLFALALAQTIWYIAALATGQSPWLSPRATIVTTLCAFALAAAHYFWATRGIVQRTLRLFEAHDVDRGDPYHDLLRNTVEEISIATGNRVPITCVVIPCASLNGIALRDVQGTAIVGVTEGLLARASRNEVQAVAAQLTGQVITCDAMVSTVAFCLFALIEEILDRTLGRGRRDFFRSSLPSNGGTAFFLLAKLFLRLGDFVNLALSRERIFRSDALSVEFTRDPMALAHVLRRLQHTWRGAGTFGPSTEAIMFAAPGRGANDTRMGFFRFLFKAQPPLNDRLARALAMAGATLESIDADIAMPTPARDEPRLTPMHLGAIGKCCPRCGAPLREVRYEGVKVEVCAGCGGRLVADNGIPRILVRHVMPIRPELRANADRLRHPQFTPRLADGGKDCPDRLACPACRAPMAHNFYSVYYFIEVDRCYSCKLIWFDHEELELLQALVEDAAREVEAVGVRM
jgi:Zn-dependent protease with chaperone function/Zn-finger nucleic acid-binding protein